MTAFSPGRAEWLGNHTDYNDGLVLGVGLEVRATVAARFTGDRQLVLVKLRPASRTLPRTAKPSRCSESPEFSHEPPRPRRGLRQPHRLQIRSYLGWDADERGSASYRFA